VYALDAGSAPGIVRVRPNGQASRFLDLPAGVFPSGITFDRFGRFGYRLLVTATSANNTQTTLYAIDCLAHPSVIAQGALHVEGGIVVAPSSFGQFGGRLIAADENTGHIYAVGRDGTVKLVADSGLPSGGDIGVEALGFVPSRLGSGAAVYFSDLGAPGSPTQGDDALLVLRGQDLARASLRSGELVAAAEGGGATIAVSCAASCSVRRVRTACPPRTAKATSRSCRAAPRASRAADQRSIVIATCSGGVASTSARAAFGITRRTSSNLAGDSANGYGAMRTRHGARSSRV
jgi:hypothetical protein